MSKQAVVGILAHVDAGKTTLAEAMLFNAGRIRKRGRVDDGDSHLDTDAIERERGITIFSSPQAVLDHGDTHVMLVDAPGHVDFSAEAERTLRALDYAILVVGANDGVQGHRNPVAPACAMTFRRSSISTKSIWRIPAAMFCWHSLGSVFPRAAWMPTELLAGGAVREDAAALERGGARGVFLKRASFLSQRCRAWLPSAKLFPCFAGSALRDQGVDELLDGICALMREQAWLPGLPRASIVSAAGIAASVWLGLK